MSQFEQILSKRVKFGYSQYWTLLAIYFQQITQGIQTIIISLTTPIVKKQWNLSNHQIQVATSLYYIGIILGNIICAILLDKFGRKIVFIYGIIYQIVVTFLLAFSQSIQFFSVMRLFYGLSFGLLLSIGPVLSAQIIPLKYRGRALLSVNFSGTIGKLTGVLMAFFCIPNLQQGNWRLMVILSAIFPIIGLILAYLKLNQSFRYLFSFKKYDQGFDILNKMIKANNQNQQQDELSQQQKEVIINWAEKYLIRNNKTQGFSSLFKLNNLRKIIVLTGVWFSVNFMFYGQLFIMPFILQEEKTLLSYFLIICGEVPSIIITTFLVQRNGYGRKNSISIFFGIIMILNIGLSFWRVTILISLSRLFMKCIFQMLYTYTPQSFETQNRAAGFAVCAGIGRGGAMLMPFILYKLYEMNIRLVFLVFSLMSGTALILSCFGAKDKINRQLDDLDQINNQDNQMISNNMGNIQLNQINYNQQENQRQEK